MMKFDFGSVAEARESGRRLVPGIQNATFVGIEFETGNSQKTQEPYNALVLKLNVDGYGELSQKIFEPKSSERTTNQWGRPQPSSLDHFMISIKIIMDALDPQADEHLKKMVGLTFKQLVEAVKKATINSVGKEVQVKLIPQGTGYSGIPGFPAGIDANGNCTISTRFLGQDLTLTPSEQKRIDAANNAKPTNMNTASVLAGMADDLNSDTKDDDLPF